MNRGIVLVVDDEPNIRELVRVYLEKEFRVVEAEDGQKGLDLARELKPQLIILDLMLPRLDGWKVCRAIRAESTTPIIMLTAKSEETDRVLGLEMGADDYLTKPFSPRELVARVHAVLRRAHPTFGVERLEFPDFTVDYAARELTVRGEKVLCPAKEFELLWLLASHPNRVFTREQLLEQVWDYDYFGDLRTVDVHVQRLRKKIEADLDNPRYIKTVWGVGYKFEGGGNR